MDDGALAVEQLDALSRAVPEEQELQELHAFLQARRRPCQPPGPWSGKCTPGPWARPWLCL